MINLGERLGIPNLTHIPSGVPIRPTSAVVSASGSLSAKASTLVAFWMTQGDREWRIRNGSATGDIVCEPVAGSAHEGMLFPSVLPDGIYIELVAGSTGLLNVSWIED